VWTVFERITSSLDQVRRLDLTGKMRDVQWGKVPSEPDRYGQRRDILAAEVAGTVVTFNDHAVRQLGARVDIPGKHFDRLPMELKVAELEHFGKAMPNRSQGLLVRTVTPRVVVDGAVGVGQDELHENRSNQYPLARAVVSGVYSIFDNRDVLQVAEPILAPLGFEMPRGLDYYDRDRLSLAVVAPVERELKTRRKGDVVKVGVRLRNSEIGDGASEVEFCLWRLVCLNGMVRAVPGVTAHLRHAHMARDQFAVTLKVALQQATAMGEVMVRQLNDASAIPLTNLDPTAGPLQERIHSTLRRVGGP
jgi:hypothetical protein